MPLYIKNEDTASLVTQLARRRGTSKQDAVRQAVAAALEQDSRALPLRARLARLRAEHPLPPATGLAADKSFFDELSGEAG
ncbi:MAG: ribbon-helix-helix protein, CopG family [Rhodospirillales bacterium]|nr:ribbon-helix-helix protein, CopG family [Rhodospirillales bacterium]